MKKVIVILGVLILLPAMAYARTFDMSADMLFSKVFEHALKIGAMPVEIDVFEMSFKTSAAPFEPASGLADCGSLSGAPVIHDKRTKTGVIYTIQVTPIDNDRSTITIKVDIDGYISDDKKAPYVAEKNRSAVLNLSCISTGGFEANLLEAMSKEYPY
jgi:hypothetical protein